MPAHIELMKLLLESPQQELITNVKQVFKQADDYLAMGVDPDQVRFAAYTTIRDILS